MHVETEIGSVITRQASLVVSGARDKTNLVKTDFQKRQSKSLWPPPSFPDPLHLSTFYPTLNEWCTHCRTQKAHRLSCEDLHWTWILEISWSSSIGRSCVAPGTPARVWEARDKQIWHRRENSEETCLSPHLINEWENDKVYGLHVLNASSWGRAMQGEAFSEHPSFT